MSENTPRNETLDSRGETDEQAEVRQTLEEKHGQVWNTVQLRQDFVVEGFSMGIVVVTRKSDNVRGSLDFTHLPRFYFNFVEAS